MKIINNENVVFTDIDNTLIVWKKIKKGDKVVMVTNPHSGEQEYFAVHEGHLRVLKERKARGAFVIAWSQGGHAWSRAVIKALGITDKVDLVMSKPIMYIDDKPAKDFMGEHLYIPYGDAYGQKTR